MHNKRVFYRMGLPLFSMVMAMLLCCVAFMGCPEAEQMTDNVLQPPTTDPNVNPNVDPNIDPNVDPNADPKPETVAPLPAGTVVFVEPRQMTSPAPGQQLQVRINIKGAADVLAYEATVGFDPTALRYVSIENADYLPTGAFASPPQVTANSVYLAATSLTDTAARVSGTLAIVTFEVVSAKASTITLSKVLLSDSNATALDFTSVDGKVRAP